jgi:hypothetical protein
MRISRSSMTRRANVSSPVALGNDSHVVASSDAGCAIRISTAAVRSTETAVSTMCESGGCRTRAFLHRAAWRRARAHRWCDLRSPVRVPRRMPVSPSRRARILLSPPNQESRSLASKHRAPKRPTSLRHLVWPLLGSNQEPSDSESLRRASWGRQFVLFAKRLGYSANSNGDRRNSRGYRRHGNGGRRQRLRVAPLHFGGGKALSLRQLPTLPSATVP